MQISPKFSAILFNKDLSIGYANDHSYDKKVEESVYVFDITDKVNQEKFKDLISLSASPNETRVEVKGILPNNSSYAYFDFQADPIKDWTVKKFSMLAELFQSAIYPKGYFEAHNNKFPLFLSPQEMITHAVRELTEKLILNLEGQSDKLATFANLADQFHDSTQA